MRGRYTLEWLDSLITISLNPEKTDVSAISDQEIKSIVPRLSEEKNKQKSLLINYVFGLTDEKHIELLLKQYHSALVVLLDQALENNKNSPDNRPVLKSITNELIECVNELLSFIEVRFSNYICRDERVPITYHSVKKEELKPRLERLKVIFRKKNVNDEIKSILLNCFNSFINRPKEAVPVTFQEVAYINELLEGIELLEEPAKTKHVYSPLDELLIYLNFNCKCYINYFRKNIEEKINSQENISDKIDKLLFYFKEFNQMYRRSGVALHPRENDLKDELGNWFTQEILYLEKKTQQSAVPMEANTERIEQRKTIAQENHKVLCALSTDQTALILRAAAELGILKARSLNEMFKTIVPHLSTPFKENLSYDSMRSKSYVAEERDKEKAIEALEKIIDWINEY
jgi:hypothetical protein